MKAKHYVNGLTLGLLVGGGIVYNITTNPHRRRKVQRFINEAEEKARSFGDRVKEKLGYMQENQFFNKNSNDDLIEIEATIISQAIVDEEDIANKKLAHNSKKEFHSSKGPKPAPSNSSEETNMGPGVC